MNIPNVGAPVNKIDRAQEFQIYKEACQLAAAYNKQLRAVDLRVITEILSYLNHENYRAYPGIKTLLNTLPIARSTLFRSLDKLEAEGHIRRHKRWNKVKRKSDSTVYVPLIPDTVMPNLRLRFANQPVPSAVLARAAKQNEQRAKMTLGSPVEMTPGSPVEMTPEPLTEPLTEPLSSTGRAVARSGLEAREGVGEEGELTQAQSHSPESLAKSLGPEGSNGGHDTYSEAAGRSIEAECFALAREIDASRGASLCAAALKHSTMPAEEVLFLLRECEANGGDIGEYLGPPMALN